MNLIEITYWTDSEYIKGYGKAIRKAKTLDALVEAIEPYMTAAEDAYVQARKLTDEDFKEYRKGLPRIKNDTDEKFIETFVTKFGTIVMPAKMTIASMMADRFKAPWGTAFIRCREEGWPMLKT